MIRTLRRRDFKERQIDAIKEQERTNKEQLIRIESQYKRLLDNYQKWKTDNKVEGIKY